MGQKITIDSATLFNKGLEMIEARWLLTNGRSDPGGRNPQSIVHSMVEFTDGSILAQMAARRMRLPIEAAIAYQPGRPGGASPGLIHCPPLTFEAVDEEDISTVALWRGTPWAGGLCPAVLSAANEKRAVANFTGAYQFLDIYCRVEAALSALRQYACGCDSIRWRMY